MPSALALSRDTHDPRQALGTRRAQTQMTPGIEFREVWKKFRRGERHDSLRDLIPAKARRMFGRAPAPEALDQKEFWAVRDMSFSVSPGEAVGIIGPNGAGKSTTLKLITRLLRPTRGNCVVRGRLGALIEVAAGFHPDLTGRENVYLQGAIMGMRRAEIRARFDAIVDFAGMSEFLDTPVKRYSSGMNARLGFSIAAHLDPDVLVIDEVLSVGDAAFQARCIERLKRMISGGTPLVFVSHNLPAVLDLCTRVVVVNRGQIQFDGAPAHGVQRYQSATFSAASSEQYEGQPMRISSVEFLDGGLPSVGVFRTGADVTLRIRFIASAPVSDPKFKVAVHNAQGTLCFATSTFGRLALGTLLGVGTIDFELPNMSLLPGCYMFSVGIYPDAGAAAYDEHNKAYPFSVESDDLDLGIVSLKHAWKPRLHP
jgi:lipopolysaccharide transport system ATP-binding protein